MALRDIMSRNFLVEEKQRMFTVPRMRCFIANACENANRAELNNLQNDNLEFLNFAILTSQISNCDFTKMSTYLCKQNSGVIKNNRIDSYESACHQQMCQL